MIRELACFVLLAAGCSSQTAAGVAPQKDAGKPGATATNAGATGLPDGALVFTGQLPACNLPSTLSGASRTFLACADCFTHAGSMCSIGVADNAADCQSCGPCVMACKPDQYAVLTGDESLSSDADADVVAPTLPAGCGGALPIMANYIANDSTSGSTWTVSCCPCQ